LVYYVYTYPEDIYIGPCQEFLYPWGILIRQKTYVKPSRDTFPIRLKAVKNPVYTLSPEKNTCVTLKMFDKPVVLYIMSRSALDVEGAF